MNYKSKEPKSLGKWNKVYGQFSQISVSDKEIWGIGGMTTYGSGKNEVYRREGVASENPLGVEWKMVPSELTIRQVSVSSDSNWVWGIDASNAIYRRRITSDNPAGTNWDRMSPWTSRWISAGETDQPWFVGMNRQGYYWQNNNWTSAGGTDLRTITAEGDQVWILGTAPNNNLVFREGINENRRGGTAWTQMNVAMADVCVNNGQVWAVGLQGQVYFRDGITKEKPMGESWQVVGGYSQKKFKQIAVNKGHFFGIDENNNLWCSQISNQYQDQIFSDETTQPQDQINMLAQQIAQLQTENKQQFEKFQTQLATQQEKINTLLEIMTGVPITEESSELRAQIKQVDLPPFNK